MKLPIRNNKNGEIVFVDDRELEKKYGFSRKDLDKKIKERQSRTVEALDAMEEAVSGKLSEDPTANKRGLYYQWITANAPKLGALDKLGEGIDADTLWDIHNNTPEPEQPQPQQQGGASSGALGGVLNFAKKLNQTPTPQGSLWRSFGIK